MTDIAVLGAGIAGLSAALELSKRGIPCTVYERRPFAGGRVYSLRDRTTGEELDNGQHVALACCSEFLGFLEEIGAAGEFVLQPGLDIPFLDPRTGRMFHLRGVCAGLSLLGMRFLSLRDRWNAARILRRMFGRPAGDLEQRTFADWLRSQGASEAAIREFWEVFILAALNERADRVAAAPCIFTFREAFGGGPAGARVGWCRRGQSFIAETAVAHLSRRGVRFEFRRGGRALQPLDGRIRLELADGTAVEHRGVICAIPHRDLLHLLPERIRHEPPFANLRELGTSPIVSVHLWYDRSPGEFDFCAVVASRISWVFHRSRVRGLPGHSLTIPLGAAREELAVPDRRLIPRFDAECRALFPPLKGARLLHSRVIREPHATFSWTPGADRLRPPAETPIPGLFLAGDWTRTGWPATMEGAVRSGRASARAAAELLQHPNKAKLLG